MTCVATQEQEREQLSLIIINVFMVFNIDRSWGSD